MHGSRACKIETSYVVCGTSPRRLPHQAALQLQVAPEDKSMKFPENKPPESRLTQAGFVNVGRRSGAGNGRHQAKTRRQHHLNYHIFASPDQDHRKLQNSKPRISIGSPTQLASRRGGSGLMRGGFEDVRIWLAACTLHKT